MESIVQSRRSSGTNDVIGLTADVDACRFFHSLHESEALATNLACQICAEKQRESVFIALRNRVQ